MIASNRWIAPFLLLLILGFGLAACGGAAPRGRPPVDLAPVGAVDGRDTFIFLYTDTWPQWAQMEPIVNGLEEEFSDRLAFERRNAVTEEGKAVMAAFGLRGHPSYAIVSPDGEHLWSSTGVLQTEALQAKVEQFAQ